MRWFKHQADSLDSAFIQLLLDKFEAQGYLAFYGLRETIAKEVGNEPLKKVRFSPSFLRRKFRISASKLEQIFRFCVANGELLGNFSEDKWEFQDCKLLELKDNYTKDLQDSCKKLAPHKEVEVEVDKKKIKKEKEPEPPKPIPASFDDFYNAYPKKKGKDAAKRAWEKIKPDTILLQVMLINIELMKQAEDWKKENGSFIPYPATWLNGKRWEDEIYDPSIPQPPTGLIDVGDATTYMLQNIPGFHADMENWIDLWVDAGNTQSEVLGKKSYADWLKFVSKFKETHNA